MEEAVTAGSRGNWNGAFDPSAYEHARRILEEDHKRTSSDVKAVAAKRGRIVLVVAVIWMICSIALVFANADLLLLAEIGWIAIVAWGVFLLLPAIMGKANLDELYEQYGKQLDRLEEARVPLPTSQDMADLSAALDFVYVPEDVSEIEH